MDGSESVLFERNVPDSTEKLLQSTVGIAGCGGLGSNAAVSLVRAGVGHLILADFDKVELSNLNRQYYFQEDIGKMKVKALADRLRTIHPHIRLDVHPIKLTPEAIPKIFNKASLLIEAFDKAESKHWLIEAWCKSFPDHPIVVGSGLSGAGKSNDLRVQKGGHVYFCGDSETDMSLGLCAPRVAMVANMEANVAISLLLGLEEI